MRRRVSGPTRSPTTPAMGLRRPVVVPAIFFFCFFVVWTCQDGGIGRTPATTFVTHVQGFAWPSHPHLRRQNYNPHRTLRPFTVTAPQGSTCQRQTVIPSEPAGEVVTNSRSIPKAETDILALWHQKGGSPKADGRGVKIAILDTGCDLMAEGLQVTSHGLPKYIDFLDCTGGGDVDTSHVVSLNHTASASDAASVIVVQGLSGRNLTLGSWAANLTQVRLGAVPLFRLLPSSVQTRLRTERAQIFRRQQQRCMANIQHELDDLQTQIDQGGSADKDAKRQLVSQAKDKRTLLEQMQAILDVYQDAGPLLDVILMEGAETGDFRAVVDVNGSGNLTESVPMAPFAKERQVGQLGFGSAVTFCIQVYDDGQTLSIVTDAGSHGTHVAGIAAAYFPSPTTSDFAYNTTTRSATTYSNNNTTIASPAEDHNGVAPGAQILACKIGDGRLGSAETGKGLIRALIAAKKYGCDLINLSYGEPSWQPDSGRVADTFTDAVHKWGMTVFTSAGNDGPALSSLGSPGTLTAPITVGAFVSPDMMVDQYATLPATEEEAPLRDASYHFSSRGPTPDGALPDLCAPGGAIAPIPRHALQGKAQYHGTSMSSPNACGVAACVLSALKQQGINTISPLELKRGLINSAKPVDVPDPFAQGSGLISATAALKYIQAHHGKPGQALSFDVHLPARNNARGIYIRDMSELHGPLTFNVNVKPRFNHAMERTAAELDELLSLELDIQLIPSQPWVTCPERLNLFSAQERGGQTFSVRLSNVVDLEPGANFAKVDAMDANDPARGPLFQLPITVIVPHSSTVSKQSPAKELASGESILLQDNGIDFTTTYRLLPGAPNRRFLSVPPHAEWATFRVRSLSPDATETSPQRILMHAIPFARGDLPNGMIQLKKLVALTERVEKTFHMKVKGGSTLEVCLQLLWLANPAPADVVLDIEFHSLSARTQSLVSSQSVVIPSAQGFARIGVASDLRSETLKPKASLTAVRRAITPSTYHIVAGSQDLDMIPPCDAESHEHGQLIYEMTLNYKFKSDAGKEVKVTPSIPSLFHQLYDSPLDSQLWVLKDSNSQILGYGGSMHHASPLALEKGDYELTFFTSHPRRKVLEEMKDVPLQLSFALGEKDGLECPIFSKLDKASTPSVSGDGRQPIKNVVLPKGSFQDVYISRPTKNPPTWTVSGDVLVGTVSLDTSTKVATSLSLSYVLTPKSKVEEYGHSTSTSDNIIAEKTLNETIFDTKVNFLSKIRKKDRPQFQQLATALLQENATNIPLLQEMLLFAKEEQGSEQINAMRNATNAFFASAGGPLDESSLAAYFGLPPIVDEDLKEDDAAALLKAEMNEKKRTLQSCLLSYSEVLSTACLSNSSYLEEFHDVYQRLRQWVTSSADLPNDKDKWTFHMVESRHLRRHGNKPGAALASLRKAGDDFPGYFKEIGDEMLSIYKTMNHTQHLITSLQNDLLKRYPPGSA